MRYSRREFFARSGGAAAALVGLSATSLTTQPPQTASPSELPEHISEYVNRRVPALLEETKVPGLAVAVVKDARLVWRRAYGVVDVETQIPVTDETIFEAGSISKPVFAYAALKLCDRGVLALDTPLTKYSAMRPLNDPRVEGITVRRVLAHTTGLPNFRTQDKPLAFAFEPGERWLYSGEAYWYLQSVMTELTGHLDPTRCAPFEAGLRVCGTDIGDYLKKSLLEPFGMSTSGYVWNDDYEQRAAQGHDINGRVRRPRRRADAVENARYAAVGGLHTTPTEYSKFLLEILEPRPSDAYRLSPAMRDEMIRPQVTLDGKTSWGLGWQIVSAPEGNRLVHSGDNPGFKAFATASPLKKAGWVVLMNGDNARPIFAELMDARCPLNEIFSDLSA